MKRYLGEPVERSVFELVKASLVSCRLGVGANEAAHGKARLKTVARL